MVVNPSSADGLAACTSAQIGLVSKSPVRFTKTEPSCPAGSKIGTVEIDTPLLGDAITGSVHLAAQKDNPFDSLLAMYIVVRGPGILGKLAGHVTANAQTGQLSTLVIDNPQVPFDVLKVRLKGGPRAPLTTPQSCGVKSASADLSSWAGHEVSTFDTFAIDCPGTASMFDPGFSAGSSSPVAGGFSPFVTRITRRSGKELGRVDVKLPKGLLADLSDVAVCGETKVASATLKTGRQTQQASVCPAASQVGSTTVGAGSGDLFYPRIPGTDVTGRVFLTGPHSGTQFPVAGQRQAAYGLAIEVPAVAGPFDLGTVLVRAAIFVDPKTAELTVVSDKLPRILQGIPLDVRDVRVNVDRSTFSRNPSSCDEQAIGATIRAQDGTGVSRSTRFQVGECAALSFKPRLGLTLTGRKQTKTKGHPGIKAVVRQAGLGEAGIDKAEVRLPKALALDIDNAGAICEYADGTRPDLENHCPAGSKVGRAKAVSPLLKRPVSGDVYFVKNVRIDPRTGRRIRTLPMIVAALRGEVAVNLYGASNVRSGRLVNAFKGVPDAPISQFNLNIRGGKNGILLVTRTAKANINVCRSKQTAESYMDGQNGKPYDRTIKVKTPCAKKKTQGKLKLRKR
jgi:hypothetical protein